MGEKETNIYDPFDVLTENYSEDYDWQEFTTKINSLPPPLRDLMFDPGLVEFVMDISADYSLPEVQTKKLSEIIGEFIMGSLQANDLPNILSQSSIAPDLAQKIRSKVSGGTVKAGEPELPTRPVFRPPFNPMAQQSPPTNPGNVVDLRNKQ